MKKIASTFFTLLLTVVLFAQGAFEGTLTVTYKNEKDDNVVAEIKVKDKQVYIKQTLNGNKKYSHFIVNLQTRDFYTVSNADSKIVIQYNLDKILEFYETNKLKEGYKRNSGLALKATDKTKEENGQKLTYATADNDNLTATAWLSESNAPISELIPLLRVLGNWNDAQSSKAIVSADVTNKADKKTTTLKVSVKKETVNASTFELPKGYAVKNFAALMEDQKGNKDINMIIQSFAQF